MCPIVILFCEQHIEKAAALPLAELKNMGTKIAVTSDDTDMYNRYTEDEIISIFRNADVLVSSYAYRLRSFFSSIELPPDVTFPKVLWIPHAASPVFMQAPFNPKPIYKMFLSGATSSYYPLRRWLRYTFAKEHKGLVKIYQHPGYASHALNQSDIYATNVRAYVAGLSTTMINRRMVAKTFEIPATGSLLLMNLDIEPMMEAVGMINMKHYVGFDQENPDPMLYWVMNPANSAVVDRIRRTGMEFVRAHHRVVDRVAALDDYFTKNSKVVYKIPEFKADNPCPIIGYSSIEACLAEYNSKISTWHYAKAKEIPFPLRKGYDKSQTKAKGFW